ITYNFCGYNFKEKSYSEKEICEVLRLGVYKKFPLLAKHKDGCELTVLFVSENQGIPLVSPDGKKEMRGVESDWMSCFDSDIWNIIVYFEELIGLMESLVVGKYEKNTNNPVCALTHRGPGFRRSKIGCYGGEQCYINK